MKIIVTGNFVGDVLEVVADRDAGAVAPPQEMKVVHDQCPYFTQQYAVQDAAGVVGGGATPRSGVGEELQHRPVEFLHPGVAGQSDPAHRPAFVTGLRGIAQCFDFPAMVLAGERQYRRGLPETRERIDRDGALGFVAILGVAVHDVPQILVQGGQLGCLDRPQVGVPFAAPPVVVLEGLLAERVKLGSCHWFRRDPGRGVHEPPPALLASQGQIVQPCRSGGFPCC
jgi:hypothetical protein